MTPRGPAPDPPPDPAPRPGLLDWLERRVNLSEIVSFVSHFGFVYTPVDSSRPVREVLRQVAAEPVPAIARGPRVLGLIAAILFGLEALTGILLACWYRPTPEAAFPSTLTIARDLPFGWFVHQMHAWGAYLLIALVSLRLLRLFWDGLYRAPRELLWVSAVALAWIVVQADFTGRLLPWDSHSYWSVVRGLEVVEAQPIVGPVLAYLVGGKVVNEDVLTRFYVLHLLVIPALFMMFLYLTFATLRRVGLSPLAAAAPQGPTTRYREHLLSMMVLSVLAFGVLVTLAVLVPLPFQNQADPYQTPPGVHPPWYMLAPYAMIERLPGPRWLKGAGLSVASIAVLLLPLAARGEETEAARRRFRLWGALAIALWVALAVFGAVLDRPR
jgi:quinol-cytochrome oxidoreductase complex cytochrome b subunit